MQKFLEEINWIFTDYTFLIIALGTTVLGAMTGILGCFAVLKKQSLLGDAISHATLPGIVLAFLWTGSKDVNILLLGALVFGIIGSLGIRNMTQKTKLKTDTSLGLILSLFFGFGMLLLTYAQKIPDANQAGLDKYLFGQAATLLESDVFILLIISFLMLIIIAAFWKEFKVFLFDAAFSKSIGFSNRFIDILMTILIVLIIVLGLQMVGVVLISALLLAPAAAARQWTNSLSLMLLLAAIFGASSGFLGTVISASSDQMATGPLIVIVASVFVFFSFLFAPKRGIVARGRKWKKNKKKWKDLQVLKKCYELESAQDSLLTEDVENLCLPKQKKALVNRKWLIKKEDCWHVSEIGKKYLRDI